jgi:hypothetical protein
VKEVKAMVRILVLGTVVMGGAALVATLPMAAAAPPGDVASAVTIVCQPGWRGSAVGVYGGVSFDVSCNNGRGVERLRGVTGTAYSIRMGVESSSVGVDCAFSGDGATVNESCAAVQLRID